MLRNPLDAFYTHMIDFQIYRNSQLINTSKGLKNSDKGTSKKFIGFYPDVDIQIGDILTNVGSNVKYFVIDVDTSIMNGKIYQIKAYYQTTEPIKESLNNTVYNIHNPSNSIIGAQESAIINNSSFNIDDLKQLIEIHGNNDKQKLNELVSLLEESLKSDTFHKSKLSKFGDTIAKHSWLPAAIAQLIASYIQSL